MATYTENYGLMKADYEDSIIYTDLNENMDIIDEQMALTEENIAGISEKIGTPDAGETVFSLLKAGGCIIKSIQHVQYELPNNQTNSTISINTVDPTKCIALYERLSTGSNNLSIKYTIETDSIQLEHPNYTNSAYVWRVGFWIIEFN